VSALSGLLRQKTERWILVIIVCLFFLGIFAGYVIAGLFPEFAQDLVKRLADSLSHLKSLHGLKLALGIFLNNLRVCFILLLIGALLPPVPCLVVYQNSFFIGVLSWVLVGPKTTPVTEVILGLVPHGLLELPTVFLAATAGTYLGWNHWKALAGRENWDWRRTLAYGKRQALIVAILLLPAAIIEVFITPLFIGG